MKNRHIQGFSLIEVAIVLAIIGVIIGMGLPILTKHYTHTKIAATKERMEHITHVLAGWVLAHGNLPRPSTNENNGTADDHAANGYIPFATIGIDENMSKDGFGKRFRYTIEPHLAHRNGEDYQKIYCAVNDSSINLTVIDPSGHPRRIAPKGDFVGFVILSTGAATDAPTPDENSNLNQVFIQKPFILSGPSKFRQIIKWETRNNLVASYGHAPCKPEIITTNTSSAADPRPRPELEDVDLDL